MLDDVRMVAGDRPSMRQKLGEAGKNSGICVGFAPSARASVRASWNWRERARKSDVISGNHTGVQSVTSA